MNKLEKIGLVSLGGLLGFATATIIFNAVIQKLLGIILN